MTASLLGVANICSCGCVVPKAGFQSAYRRKHWVFTTEPLFFFLVSVLDRFFLKNNLNITAIHACIQLM